MFWKKQTELPVEATANESSVDRFIETMSYLELKALSDKLAALMAEQFKQARDEFQRDFLDKLAAFDLTIDDLKPKKKKRIAAVKFRDPDNPENTWSGLGKPKKWLQDKLDQGQVLDEFAIQ